MSEGLAKQQTPPPWCEAGGYVQALVAWGRAQGLLADDEAAALGERLGGLFRTRGLRKLAGDSASMRVEVARDVMDGALYTLGLHLKQQPDAETALRALAGADASMDGLYREARQTLKGQFQTTRRLWRAVRNTAVPTPHIAYRETLLEGIGGFFRWYDMDFAPHQTPGDIDYPLALPVPDGGGVEYVHGWLERLLLENRFCRRFAPEEIHRVMLAVHPEYPALLLNLFDPVLMHALGPYLDRDRESLGETQEKTARLLAGAAERLCANLGIKPGDPLVAYAARVAKNNAAAYHAAAQKAL